MNERFLVRLKKDGRSLPVNALSAEGLLLRNETDAWPRGMVLEFDAQSTITAYRMDRVRHLKGWRRWEYHLLPFLEKGMLGFAGVETDALPGGNYWFRLKIADLKLRKGRHALAIPEDGEAVVDLEVEDDPRQVALADDVASFDARIRRVLEAAGSRADGASLVDWLTSAAPRARRKASLLNLLATLRVSPTATLPLIDNLRHVFFVDVDRIYAAVDRTLYERLEALAADPKKPFYAEGTPKSATHRKLLKRIEPMERDAQSFTLHSFRQEGKPSLQAVVARPPEGPATRVCYADLDIDLGNPVQDVQGFFIHMGELLDPGATDHLALWKKLRRGRAGQYLNYRVVQE